jgi:hypothetical protein
MNKTFSFLEAPKTLIIYFGVLGKIWGTIARKLY